MFRNRCDNVADAKPVRVIPRSRRSVAGFWATRRGGSIQYESTLERDFITLQDYSLLVSAVISQPCEIPFTARSGRTYKYTPDFLVHYCADSASPGPGRPSMLVEVKPEEAWRVHWREWMPKWKAARRYAKEQGWIFKVFDESRIRTRALINIQFLRRYQDSQGHYPEEFSATLLHGVQRLGLPTVGEVLAKFFVADGLEGNSRARGVAHLWHLLAARRLECDIREPLDDHLQVWVPRSEMEHR